MPCPYKNNGKTLLYERRSSSGICSLGRGTYVLILRLPDSRTIQVGKLGTFDFAAGYYAYVGSALGSGGLGARLKHHLRENARPHWHVDYLRRVASVEAIWLVESGAPHEHEWAALLGEMPGVTLPVRRFGASDCACPSHLFYFRQAPSVSEFRARTSGLYPDHERVRCVRPGAAEFHFTTS